MKKFSLSLKKWINDQNQQLLKKKSWCWIWGCLCLCGGGAMQKKCFSGLKYLCFKSLACSWALTGAMTSKHGSVRVKSWARWSMWPCFYICSGKLPGGQRNFKAASWHISGWVCPLRFCKVENCVENNAAPSLVVSSCLSLFPETGIWSAGQCSNLVLHSTWGNTDLWHADCGGNLDPELQQNWLNSAF